MAENEEIKEFVNKALQQLKTALPEGYKLNNQINFDISVTTLTKRPPRVRWVCSVAEDPMVNWRSKTNKRLILH